MKKRDDTVYLRHILDSIETIEEHKKGIGEKEFARNKLVQDAIIRQLGIIGEAGKRVSTDIRKKYSRVSWKDMAGMRDKLVHDYFGVKLEAVWETVEKDLPQLEEQIEKILKDLS